MPAFFTHYAFGVKNYKNMEDGTLKHIIKEHKHAYALGTIGPDIFLYYIPYMRLGEKSPGNVMHESHTQLFFENMLKRAELMERKNQKIAYAYIAGFIAHYELDVNCHPFVYETADSPKAHERHSEHFALEAAMDVYCSYEYLHRIPTELKQREIIGLSRQERKIISTLIADAYSVTYHKPKQSRLQITMVIKSMRRVIRCLEDKRGIREKVWNRLEQILFGHTVTSPLFINNNTYSYTVEDWYVFHQYWKKGLKDYQNVMTSYQKYVAKRGDKRKVRKEVLKSLGNESYHKGKVFYQS